MGFLGAAVHFVAKKAVGAVVKQIVIHVAGQGAGVAVSAALGGPVGLALSIILIANPVF